ncbi:1-phosphofructokinase [Rhodococcus jostii RHA1] [Mycolicibacterium parafortuitum]|uniref:1-phosphofructokinase [Rhodococcus jostii RHA1] n=1 Tax=Mycolicibacterium parafortuitum TaxID=39692 RepID=A0A375YMV3_MYCPF|nr:1-phosphofructokinase [Rhodococcus jostii RHA1] [Mycolicibacterium parafortuitum]
MDCRGDTRDLPLRVMSRPDIVTLTVNPALDVTAAAEKVVPTEKIRCQAERYDAGGGGLNVARFATALGAAVAAVYTAGGATGTRITEMLAAENVSGTAIPIKGPTRESFTVNELSTGRQYRFVLPGPTLTAGEQAQCLDALRRAAAEAQFVVASGSLPPGVPPDFYQLVAGLCADLGARLILDTSGGGLTHISSGVFLLKPSVRELRECVGHEVDTVEGQRSRARPDRSWRGRNHRGVPGCRRGASGHLCCEQTLFGDSGDHGQWCRCRRRDGRRHYLRTYPQMGSAACGPLRDRRSDSQAEHCRHLGVSPRRGRSFVRPAVCALRKLALILCALARSVAPWRCVREEPGGR